MTHEQKVCCMSGWGYTLATSSLMYGQSKRFVICGTPSTPRKRRGQTTHSYGSFTSM